MEKFTWIPFFKEIEDKIHTISRDSNKNEQLIQALHQVGIEKGLQDQFNGRTIVLSEIDPFSFLAMFLKYGIASRKRYFLKLKKLWNLVEAVPRDFDGVPSANAQKTWLFPYKDERGLNDISYLWLLFTQLHNGKIEDDVFKNVLNIKNVGFTRLTQVLFWYAPSKFLPIDTHTIPFLENYNINTELSNLPKDYYQLMDEVSDKFTRTYYEISESSVEHTAFRKGNAKNKSKDDDTGFKPLIPSNFNRSTLFGDENENKINYYSVGFHWDGDKSQLDRFLKEGIWENGYDGKFANVVKEIKVGDKIALKTTYTKNDSKGKKISATKIHNIGTVTENPKDGKIIKVNWQDNFEPYELERKGVYRKTISKVQNTDNIDLIFRNNENMTEKNQPNASLGVDVGNLSLNTIFYGPPGTGKTYKLQHEYFPLFTTKKEQVTRKQYVDNIISELSWWEVIAMAMLDIGKPCKVADITVHEFVLIKSNISSSKNINPIIWGQLQAHTIEESKTVNFTNRTNPLIFNKSTSKSNWYIVEEKKEQIENLQILLMDILSYEPEKAESIKRYKFVSFHQSYSYEDFIEGIKPVMSSEDAPQTEVAYEIKKGVFKELCELADKDPNNPYALFIDEINRGNISNIFGELITLIEKDKRKGKDNELTLDLTYSKKPFSVPSNVYIIGTMNTADRSVETLDNALRRRFDFVEMLPDYEMLEPIEDENIDTKYLLETLNKRLVALLDREHQIGHSYFMNIDTLTELMETFNKKIIPLLQEYFYNDYDKIGMVMGKGFVSRLPSDVEFATDYNAEDEPEISTSYELVYHQVKEDFIQALQSAGLQPTAEG